MKIISYNLNGIRAANKLGVLDWLKKENADIICLQEVRADQTICDQILNKLEKYDIIYNCGTTRGYAGTAVLSKKSPQKFELGFKDKEDSEGRIITAEYNDFIIINVYVPNGSKRLEYKKEFLEKLIESLKELLKRKKYIFLCFDANIAHKEIDVNKPKEVSRKSGFLIEERKIMDKLLCDEFVDSYRILNPNSVQYTWRSYKARKEKQDYGWRFRFDYILCSKKIITKLRRCYSLDLEYSDHLPVILEVELNGKGNDL